MGLFENLKKGIESVATPRTKVTSTKSLKKILEIVDYNVFRFRKKTGKTYSGKRGGSHEQRQLQDCTIINLPQGYKLYTLNLQQFLAKTNGKYPETVNGQQANLKAKKDFSIKKIPQEVLTDSGITITKEETSSKKTGYVAFLLQNGNLVPLRRKEFSNIKLKASRSHKTLYRETRDGSLENSFIKQLGLLISSCVVDKEGHQLLDIDINPKNYVPRRERTSDGDSDSKNEEVSNSLDGNEAFECEIIEDSTLDDNSTVQLLSSFVSEEDLNEELRDIIQDEKTIKKGIEKMLKKEKEGKLFGVNFRALDNIEFSANDFEISSRVGTGNTTLLEVERTFEKIKTMYSELISMFEDNTNLKIVYHKDGHFSVVGPIVELSTIGREVYGPIIEGTSRDYGESIFNDIVFPNNVIIAGHQYENEGRLFFFDEEPCESYSIVNIRKDSIQRTFNSTDEATTFVEDYIDSISQKAIENYKIGDKKDINYYVRLFI